MKNLTTNPIESLIAGIAPHRCLLCKSEGSLVCPACLPGAFIQPPSRCYRCHKATPQSKVCRSCRKYSPISHVWVATEYELVAKQLIYKLKFDRANAGSKIIAQVIGESLPDLPQDTLVTYVPTANKRVRIRGYDQSKLISKHLARLRGWEHINSLRRLGSSRQVGSSRIQRLRQLEGAFQLANRAKCKDRHILLIDDVLTTGATVETASKVLKQAGAKTVEVAVFTQPVE